MDTHKMTLLFKKIKIKKKSSELEKSRWNSSQYEVSIVSYPSLFLIKTVKTCFVQPTI